MQTHTHIHMHKHTYRHAQKQTHVYSFIHPHAYNKQKHDITQTCTHVIICNTQSNICCVGLLRENNNLTWHTQMFMTQQQIYIRYKTDKA